MTPRICEHCGDEIPYFKRIGPTRYAKMRFHDVACQAAWQRKPAHRKLTIRLANTLLIWLHYEAKRTGRTVTDVVTSAVESVKGGSGKARQSS